MSSLLPIPQVPKQYLGLLGNLPDIDPVNFAESIWHLTDLYGPIFQLDLVNSKPIVVSNYELVSDVQDDTRFEKLVAGITHNLKILLGDGLFTAGTQSELWAKAHRILMPVFGPMAIRKMFDQQLEIASQMILRWDRLGPNNQITCSDDFTRLAFDTIAYCVFSFRFNEFYSDNVHPWAQSMADVLIEVGKRTRRTTLETRLRKFAEQKMYKDINEMYKLIDEILEDRIQNPQPENHDLLHAMLNNEDPATGEKLSKENIREQMTTFLVAGHETTSGTLSFLFYHFLKNPDKLLKAQKEVDQVLGDGNLNVEHVGKLKYVDACVKETLRLMGPITMIQQHSKGPDVIAGKYAVNPSDPLLLNLKYYHHDPAVWGEDHNDFKPERMLDMSKYPPGAFKAFGIGMRACIGRAFAEQEILINVALILQRFQVDMADSSYQLALKSTLTIKPLDWKIKVRRRPGKSLMVGLSTTNNEHHGENRPSEQKHTGKPLTILYGSNAGTCQAYAQDFASNASQFGFASNIRTMDSATEDLPKDHPVVIITPSYEGRPADNAKKFVSWLEAGQHNFDGIRYLLFGVGNSEWTSTFHKIPLLVDQKLRIMGARSIAPSGFVDIKSDTIGPWEDWCAKLWPILAGDAIQSKVPTVKGTIKESTTSSILAGFETSTAIVRENIELADNSVGPRKMHMEVELPEGVTYQTGDYLAILPYNHPSNVQRVLNRFHLRADNMLSITDTRKQFLKTNHPTSLHDFLSTRLELGLPITQQQLNKLVEVTTDETEKSLLSALDYSELLLRRTSLIDILERFPSCQLDFLEYLDMLKALTPRQYSISSSPLTHRNFNAPSLRASITYDVIEQDALSGQGVFRGVSSTYLANVKEGDRINCTVRATNVAFHLPTDIQVPIIMICAGTGLAPMRGFIEERSALKAARGNLGPALLYFGCRDPVSDYIYKRELEHWEREGICSLRPTFSRYEEGFKYTSDRLYAEKEEVAKLFRDGAKIFICGSASKVAKSTAETCIRIWKEKHPEKSQEEAEAWLDSIKEERYVSDVFG